MFSGTQRSPRTGGLLHHQFRYYAELVGIHCWDELLSHWLHDLSEWYFYRDHCEYYLQRDRLIAGDAVQLHGGGQRFFWSLGPEFTGECYNTV